MTQTTEPVKPLLAPGERVCSTCKGTGRIITGFVITTCWMCLGTGKTDQARYNYLQGPR